MVAGVTIPSTLPRLNKRVSHNAADGQIHLLRRMSGWILRVRICRSLNRLFPKEALAGRRLEPHEGWYGENAYIAGRRALIPIVA